ncbi:MAG: DsbA family protein [Kofleriaceae bacterium]
MRSLPILALFVGSVAVVGCENAASKLDDVSKTPVSKVTENGKNAEAPGATPVQADHSGTVEERLKRLEDYQAKHGEAIDFLEKVYGQQKAQEQAQQRQQHAPDAMFAVDVADDVRIGAVDGPANAPVTIVKAFDFACPYCERVSGTMEELVKEYGGKVRVVYKNLVVHPQVATDAHLASCAAAKQGKYMPFKELLWEKGFKAYASARDPSKLAEANLLAIAGEAGLNVDRLKTDMRSDECKKLLAVDAAEMQKFQVNSTPTFFINGQHIGGALDKASFKQIIDEKLKEVEKSGVPAGEYYAKVVLGKGEKKFRSMMDPKPN